MSSKNPTAAERFRIYLSHNLGVLERTRRAIRPVGEGLAADYRRPHKIRIKKTTGWLWEVLPPKGMWFAPDQSIGRPVESPTRIFVRFADATEYVADGRAQRALEPEPAQ